MFLKKKNEYKIQHEKYNIEIFCFSLILKKLQIIEI